MTAFAAALGALFADPNLAVDALWRRGGDGEAIPARVMRRAPDVTADFGAGRFVTNAIWLDVRISDIACLEAGDTFQIGDELLEVRSTPRRDTERLIWTAEARVL